MLDAILNSDALVGALITLAIVTLGVILFNSIREARDRAEAKRLSDLARAGDAKASGDTPTPPEASGGFMQWISRLWTPGTLLNSSPLVQIGIVLVGFGVMRWLPHVDSTLYMIGVIGCAAACSIAAILALDRWVIKYPLLQAIEEKNTAAGLVLVAFALPLAAAVLGVAILGITIISG